VLITNFFLKTNHRYDQFYNFKRLKTKICCTIFEIFRSHAKLFVSNHVLNFQIFSLKIKVFIVLKLQKKFQNSIFNSKMIEIV